MTFDNFLTVHLIPAHIDVEMYHYVGTRHSDESTMINIQRPFKRLASIWVKKKYRLFELQILKPCLHL